MRTLIQHATLVNEGKEYKGNLLIDGEQIADIWADTDKTSPSVQADQFIDATGYYLLPGAIDDHVHFRDPGLTHKADMYTESRAALKGGVTSIMDMPNCKPLTTTIETLEKKFTDAHERCMTNYSFYLGATSDNIDEIKKVDPKRVCGVKVFMGSSTGNMLVDDAQALRQIFSLSPTLIALHCEDQDIIAANIAQCKAQGNNDPEVSMHPVIRNEEACFRSTAQAIALAKETGANIHVLHISTARELELFEQKDIDEKKITAEACIAHLYFTDADYARLGTRIKCNPAIKTANDREALRKALIDGRIDVIGTDHAPHLPEEKQGGCLTAASGMPSIQYVLPAMLELMDEGIVTLPLIVEKMAHNPARRYHIEKRGYLRKGYRADLVLVKPHSPHTVDAKDIASKCKWSPFEGHTFQWEVTHTWVNGHLAYHKGIWDQTNHSQRLTFNR